MLKIDEILDFLILVAKPGGPKYPPLLCHKNPPPAQKPPPTIFPLYFAHLAAEGKTGAAKGAPNATGYTLSNNAYARNSRPSLFNDLKCIIYIILY